MFFDWWIVSSIYFTSVALFLGFTSLFLFWLLLEINLICFVLLMVYSDRSNHSMISGMLFYFVIQSLGSVFFLLFCVLGFAGCTKGWAILFFISFTMKLGLYPFHSWVFSLSPFLSTLPFCFLLTFQKVPMCLLFMTTNFDSNLALILVALSFVSGLVFMFMSRSLVEIMVSSSVYNFLWLMIFIFMGLQVFLTYMMFYCFHLFILIKSCAKQVGIMLSTRNLSIISSVLFFMGLPPFSPFFFKFYSISLMHSVMSPSFFVLVWLISFSALFCYFKFFLNMTTNYYPPVASYTPSNLKFILFSIFMSLTLMT